MCKISDFSPSELAFYSSDHYSLYKVFLYKGIYTKYRDHRCLSYEKIAQLKLSQEFYDYRLFYHACKGIGLDRCQCLKANLSQGRKNECKSKTRDHTKYGPQRLIRALDNRKLHNSGKSYQDLNDGGFFIRPTDGDIKICD